MLLAQPIFNEDTSTILIVDDNKIVLDLLAEGFKVFGFRVLTAQDGLTAWKTFEAEHIDIVLSDLYMPDLDGIELTRRIRKRSTGVKIAVMTGGNREEASQLMKDGVADYFFSKPFDLISVCKSLQGAMQVAMKSA